MNNQFCLTIKICLPLPCRHKLLEYGILKIAYKLGRKANLVDQGYIGPDFYQVQKNAVHGYSFSVQSSSSKDFMTSAGSSYPFLK